MRKFLFMTRFRYHHIWWFPVSIKTDILPFLFLHFVESSVQYILSVIYPWLWYVFIDHWFTLLHICNLPHVIYFFIQVLRLQCMLKSASYILHPGHLQASGQGLKVRIETHVVCMSAGDNGEMIAIVMYNTLLEQRAGTWSSLCPHGPLARCIKLRFAHAPGMPGTFLPPPTSKETAG